MILLVLTHLIKTNPSFFFLLYQIYPLNGNLNEIRAIPTNYKGHCFRSRLEARWAVFYDTLGIVWHYEPVQDFVSGARIMGPEYGYKPDFYLPELDKWVEIKPNEPNEKARSKAAGWARHYGDTYVFFGEIAAPQPDSKSAYLFYLNTKQDTVALSEGHFWCECQICGKVDIRQGGGWPESCDQGCFTAERYEWFEQTNPEMLVGESTPRLIAAYRTARLWRFDNSG
jgi:hypothetical protein